MNKEFKKNFFTCLLAVLLVVSNLLSQKLTIILGLSTEVSFVTFPFTFLCTLLIVNLGDKKDAYRSILSASVIQLLITISYTIAINLNSQDLVSDSSIFINEVFRVNEFYILSSVLSFILSHCLLIYIYDNFKYFKKEFYGVLIGLLGAMFLNSVVYLGLSLRDYEVMYIVDRILISIIIDLVMIAVITILFYILKDHNKEVIVKEQVLTENKNLDIEKVDNTKTKTVRKQTNTKKNYRNNNSRKTNNQSNAKTKTKNKTTSKKSVNKENN